MADSVDLGPLTHCKCGCGQIIANFDRYGRPREYANGHNMKALWRVIKTKVALTK